MTTDYAGPAKRALAGLAVGTLIAGAPLLTAQRPEWNEPVRARSLTQKPVEPVVEAGDPACQSARRKMWVDGRGWIVRQVTRCV